MPKNENKSQVHLLILILSIVAGATSGIVASLVTQRSLEDYALSLLNGGQLITISEPRPQPLPGTYEEALVRVQDAGWPATAFIRAVSTDATSSSEWITKESAVGQGSVVTSDGWVLFNKDALAAFTNPKAQAEIWILGSSYPVAKVVEDSLTDFVLIKVDASGMPALAFADSEDFYGGEILFEMTGDLDIFPTSLADSEQLAGNLVAPAEQYATEWQMTDAFDAPAPFLNASGELAAFGTGTDRAVPIHHLKPFIQSVLRYGEPRYAGLGAEVASIHEILNLDPAIADRTGSSGAIIALPDRWTPAVIDGSPADDADLHANDVILFVDDVPVSDRVSLSELLKAYEPGDEAVLTVFRGDEDLEILVTFVDASDLVY